MLPLVRTRTIIGEKSYLSGSGVICFGNCGWPNPAGCNPKVNEAVNGMVNTRTLMAEREN